MRFIFSINHLNTEPLGWLGTIPAYSLGCSIKAETKDLTLEQVKAFLYPLLTVYGIVDAGQQLALAKALTDIASRAPENQPTLEEFTGLGVWMSAEFEIPENKANFDFEFELEIRHPSQPYPWRVTGTGLMPHIEALILGGLTQNTKLPQHPLWNEFTTQIKEFLNHVLNCDDYDHSLTFNELDYSVSLTISTLGESETPSPLANKNLH